MSEFSQYFLVRGAVDGVELLEQLRATGFVIPNRAPWTLIVSPDAEDLEDSQLPLMLAYSFAADHEFELRAYKNGELVARLSARTEGGPTYKFRAEEWVEHQLMPEKIAMMLEAIFKKGAFTHRSIRDEVSRLLGFRAEPQLRGEDLIDQIEELSERFQNGVFVRDGKRVVRGQETAEPSIDDVDDDLIDDEDEQEDEKPKKTAKAEKSAKAEKPAKKKATISAEEGRELARAFKNAAPLTAKPAANLDEVDFAGCTTPRAWLDAKNLVDPARASANVQKELERTVREGRFAGTGDPETVVREAAAMLLARCYFSQDVKNAEAIFIAHETAAQSNAERSAWTAAIGRYRALKKPVKVKAD